MSWRMLLDAHCIFITGLEEDSKNAFSGAYDKHTRVTSIEDERARSSGGRDVQLLILIRLKQPLRPKL